MPSTRQCKGKNKEGLPCQKAAQYDEDLCWSHNPNNHAERVRTASRGGRGHVNREARDARAYLRALRDEVRDGTCPPNVGAVVNQVVNTMLRSIEVERKLEETDVRSEFEELKRELGIS